VFVTKKSTTARNGASKLSQCVRGPILIPGLKTRKLEVLNRIVHFLRLFISMILHAEYTA